MEGTIYYAITKEKLEDAMRAINLILWKDVKDSGFDSIEVDSLFGSAIISDILYVCSTDGIMIDVDGELVDPEIALDEYSEDLDKLSDYIVEANFQETTNLISEYEFYLYSESKAQEIVTELLESYNLSEVVGDLIALSDSGMLDFDL